VTRALPVGRYRWCPGAACSRSMMFCTPWRFFWYRNHKQPATHRWLFRHSGAPDDQAASRWPALVVPPWLDAPSCEASLVPSASSPVFLARTMAVESRLMCPTSSSARYSSTSASWTQLPRLLIANSAKACDKVGSDGISPEVVKPHIRRRFSAESKARRRSLVVGCRQSAFATNARAHACRSRGLRPG